MKIKPRKGPGRRPLGRKVVNITLPPALIAAVDSAAAARGVTRSSIMEEWAELGLMRERGRVAAQR